MLKRYDLRSNRETHEGWAIIVIDTSNGYFSTVSDYGNYSYIWSSPGCEFRKFLCGLGVDYLRSKLLHGHADKLRVFNEDETEAAIKQAIKERLESMAEARRSPIKMAEWNEREQAVLEKYSSMSESNFDAWQSETTLDEPWEFAVWEPDPQCTAFCEKVWPRFKKLLEEELEKEEKAKAESEVIKYLFASADVDEKLRLMSDTEIANIVLNHVWSQTNMFSPEDSLLQTVIERLTRTGNGALPSPKDG